MFGILYEFTDPLDGEKVGHPFDIPFPGGSLAPWEKNETVVHFWLFRNNGELIMWDYLGDPDSEVFIDFHKLQ